MSTTPMPQDDTVVPVEVPLTAEPEGRPTAGGSTRRRIVTAAAIIMVGQLLSSVLGMVRIETLNVLFYGAASGAFIVALKPIQQINDLLIGGSVSGALIPTFVDYSDPEKRAELRRVYSTVLNLVLLVMGAAVLVLFVAAPALLPIWVQNSDKVDAGSQQLIVTLVRITAFSLFGLGLYAVTSALLYALKQVVFPAFATGIYHVAVVVAGVVTLIIAAAQLHLPLGQLFATDANPLVAQAHLVGARGLAAGAALGALCEFLILIPGLRRAGVSWRPVLNLRHPAVRQILVLYAPIAGLLLFNIAQQNLDIALQLRTPGGALENATALQSATTLIQFPTGLVAAALSFAVLPSLTAAANAGDMDEFKRILALGFRLGLLLMVPATVGLIVLRYPIVELLFQHGTCQAANGCTLRNALALQNYAYQLPFLALDQLLIAAFYARKNTLVPAVIGVLSIGFYLAIALPFAGTIGMPAIAFANAALNTGHALVLLVLLIRAIGTLGQRELLLGGARIGAAALAMGLVTAGLLALLPQVAPAAFAGSRLSPLLLLLVAGGLGSAVYFGAALALRVDEVHLLRNIIRARLGGARG